ncbi:MAG: gene transfer agent family protein [Devosia sp.]
MHTAFFGDRERAFALTPLVIPELQRTTAKGIGAIIDSLRRLTYAEITETIRLGLVGGGTQPGEAAALVSTYVPARPLGEANILAIDILTDLWVGPVAEEVKDDF